MRPLALAVPLARLALALALVPPASASDGVVEINQTCAVQTGCFPGDTGGLPVTITASGSYRLTSNLVVPNENTDAITVGANDVGIDLADFALIGPVVCSGTPTTCSFASGSGSGIERTTISIAGTSVRHGAISGMGASGILLGDDAIVTDLRIRSNRTGGVAVGTNSVVSGSSVSQNGGRGIDVNSGSAVAGNAVARNGSDGIHVVNGPAIVSGNVVNDNASIGIASSFGSTVSDNSVYSNGGSGISTAGGNSIRGNTVRNNEGFGLDLGSTSSYGDNTISVNVGGTVQGTTIVNTGGNACNGTAVCP